MAFDIRLVALDNGHRNSKWNGLSGWHIPYHL